MSQLLKNLQKLAPKDFPRACLSLSLISFSVSTFSQEVDLKASINSTAYIYETQLGENEAVQNESITISPSLLTSYSGRHFSASLSANHSLVKKNDESMLEGENNNETSQRYTNLQYKTKLELIQNVLSVSLNGSQNYRNVSQNQDYFSDQVLSPNGLTKTKTNIAQMNFTTPNPGSIGLDIQGTYSTSETERSLDSEFGLDNDNTAVTAKLFQGRNVKNINFSLNASYNDTSRANSQNFESTRLQGKFGFPVYRDLDFIITGSLEEYDTGNNALVTRGDIDTSSYGAGLEWNPSNGSNLSVTYNQLEKADETTDFVGVNLAWAFSTRTSINFDYGQRFYGDSYQFNFKHSLKNLKAAISYSEDVTSYARLGDTATTITGIFVCEFGSTELTDCFQPDSLDYQLQAGEEFRAATETETDITEEVMFRKTGTAIIGYDKRKIKMAIEARYQSTEYLESDRLRTNHSLRFNLTYALGRRTNLSLVTSAVESKSSLEGEPDKILNTSLTFSRTLGQRLNLNMSARWLDRQSDIIQRDGTDKRLTLGIKYTFN